MIPILPFLNDPKDLDPSYKTDLDLCDCFGRKKTPSYNRRNTVVINRLQLDQTVFLKTQNGSMLKNETFFLFKDSSIYAQKTQIISRTISSASSLFA